jgi:hypothetical protein
MTTSSASSVIGPVEHRILRAADRAQGRVWRVDDGEAIGLTPSSLHQALARLVAVACLREGTSLLPRAWDHLGGPLTGTDWIIATSAALVNRQAPAR